MAKVLVIEDTRFFATVIRRGIENGIGLQVTCASTLAEAVHIVETDPDGFFLALCDYTLPDALDGQAIDYVVEVGIPTIVFTGHFSPQLRESLFARNIIDYVVKENSASLDYMLSLVARIHKNRLVKVLIVDDSATARHYSANLLRRYHYNVLEATDGVEALAVLEAHPDLSLILTDYDMPNMDGFALIRQVRSRYARHELPIIGLSGHSNTMLSARFIKQGANDFLSKPFSREEFFCRVSQNVEFIEQVRALKDAANRDYLTGLYNRRFLFARGAILLAQARTQDRPVTLAMMDIDFFKKVNDTYGHDMGDEVLRQIARVIGDHFGQDDVVARMGGEEFCILVSRPDDQDRTTLFEQVRAAIERRPVTCGAATIHATVSIGVCHGRATSLDELITEADNRLYTAKHSGRNRVVSA